MSNTLTDLAADLYKAADVVGRELVGLIPSVTVNAGAQEAAKGDNVRSHFTRTPTVNNSFAPSMTIPEGTDQTVDNKVLQLNQYASVQIPWTGEDIKHVNNAYRDWETDRKSTRLNSSHSRASRMPSSA